MTSMSSTTTQRCDSCGMPLESAHDHALGRLDFPYCRHCAPGGRLQSFKERFDEMVQLAMREQGLDRETAEARTRDYLRTMPAWKNHPALAAK